MSKHEKPLEGYFRRHVWVTASSENLLPAGLTLLARADGRPELWLVVGDD